MIYALIFGAFIAVLFFLARRNPSALLVALFGIFAIKGWLQVSDPFFLQNRTAINFVYGGMIALLFLLRLPACLKAAANPSRAFLLVACLFLYASLSLLWTPDAAQAGDRWLRDYPYVLINIVAIPLLLHRCDWATFARLQIVLGTIFSLLLLLTAKWATRGLALGNDETNPLEIAQLGAITGICAIYCPLKRIPAAPLLRLAVLGVSVVLILKSGSRGQLISMMVSLLLVWLAINGLFNARKSAAMFVGAGVLVSATLWGIGEYWSKTHPERYTADRMSDDIEGRLDMAVKLIGAWWDSPVNILLGLGNSAAFDPAIVGIYPHFLPLEILGEEGLIGIVIYVALLWTLGARLLRAIRGIRLKRYSKPFVANFSIATAIWIYTFLLTLKQGNLVGNTIFFTVSVLLYQTIASMDRVHRLNRRAASNANTAGHGSPHFPTPASPTTTAYHRRNAV